MTTNCIKFCQKPGMSGHVATFEICNSANIAVAYDFILDSESSAFGIESGKCGTVGPNGHTYVKIRFSADAPGTYYQILYCVLQYQVTFYILLEHP